MKDRKAQAGWPFRRMRTALDILIILKSCRETHCHYCLNQLRADTVPCTSCTIPLYCSEHCQIQAGGAPFSNFQDKIGTKETHSHSHGEYKFALCSDSNPIECFPEHKHECLGVNWPAILPSDIGLSHSYTQNTPESKLELHIYAIVLLCCLQHYFSVELPINGVSLSQTIIPYISNAVFVQPLLLCQTFMHIFFRVLCYNINTNNRVRVNRLSPGVGPTVLRFGAIGTVKTSLRYLADKYYISMPIINAVASLALKFNNTPFHIHTWILFALWLNIVIWMLSHIAKPSTLSLGVISRGCRKAIISKDITGKPHPLFRMLQGPLRLPINARDHCRRNQSRYSKHCMILITLSLDMNWSSLQAFSYPWMTLQLWTAQTIWLDICAQFLKRVAHRCSTPIPQEAMAKYTTKLGAVPDPCGAPWEGVTCSNSRITALGLSTMNLKGKLSGDIGGLTELRSLDLSFNTNLTGSLTPR
ncbi:hypothetical protein NC652_035732 [Populus alba x Populus x berolinensis]|nr:hypothetical protein NC652_035732 [Populus alba x Populus x berolinensis]